MRLIAKNKKGVSVMIGYILLISMAVVMGGVMYAWMKSYVPTESIECPEGVSMIIKQYDYNCTEKILNITVKNNGRFSAAGYYIKGAQYADQNIADIDLSKRNVKSSVEVYKYGGAIVLGASNENEFVPGNETLNSFDLSGLDFDLKKIEITPVRWEKVEGKIRFVGCGDTTKFKELLECEY